MVASQELCGAPFRTPQTPGTAAQWTSFPPFTRYLLRDRLIYQGESNTDWRFWGTNRGFNNTADPVNKVCGFPTYCAANGPCENGAERLAFLLGAKLDVMTPAGNPVLDQIISERQRVKWWTRRPQFLYLQGLTGLPAASTKVEITHFRDVNGADLAAISNPKLVSGLSFSLNGQSLAVPVQKIAIIDTAGTLVDTRPPQITNVQVSNIGTSAATISWLTDEPATTQVNYGSTTSYGQQTPVNNNLVTGHSVALTSLSANTIYHYRLSSTDASGNSQTSIDLTFTTLSADTRPPQIANVNVSNISSSAATITWTTDEPATTQAIYGTTTSYGQQTTLNTALVTTHSVTLSGLSAGTLYHYRLRGSDAAGNSQMTVDLTLTTAAITSSDIKPPQISNVQVSSIGRSSATITWVTDEAATAQVIYGVTTSYGQQSALDTRLLTTHTASLSGLSTGTLYHYRLRGTDAAGNAQTTVDLSFNTLP
jgi:hypothetical protein